MNYRAATIFMYGVYIRESRDFVREREGKGDKCARRGID